MKHIRMIIAMLVLAPPCFASGINEADIINFLGEWFEAQNTGEYSKYAAMYSDSFIGVKRSGTKMFELNHDAWLKDRKKMFHKIIKVRSNTPTIKFRGQTAFVRFEQTWESGRYRDKGDKELQICIERGVLKIIREEMLFSKIIPNYDSDGYHGSARDETSSSSGITTKYTSIKFEDCWYPVGFNEYTHECPAQKGWRLFVVADEERSWLEIGKGQRLWTTQNEVNGSGDNAFGQMQDLGDLTRVEWLLRRDGTPIAMIFRVQAMEEPRIDVDSAEDTSRLVSRFYTVDLSKGVPRFCGMFNTVDKARRKANDPTNCKGFQERSSN